MKRRAALVLPRIYQSSREAGACVSRMSEAIRRRKKASYDDGNQRAAVTLTAGAKEIASESRTGLRPLDDTRKRKREQLRCARCMHARHAQEVEAEGVKVGNTGRAG